MELANVVIGKRVITEKSVKVMMKSGEALWLRVQREKKETNMGGNNGNLPCQRTKNRSVKYSRMKENGTV